MIGNNFILQPKSDENPLLIAALRNEKKSAATAPSALCPSSMLLLDELKKLDVALEDHLLDFTKELLHVHVIANQSLAEKRGDDLIATAAELEELEIEPIDIRQNPERAAWAVKNHALVALKQPDSKERKTEARFAPRWSDLVEKGKIKQLKVKNQKGEIQKAVNLKEIVITQLTAEEINYISTVIIKAVALVSQIRSLEQQRKEIEEKHKKAQEEIKNREKQFREELLQRRLKRQMVHEKSAVRAAARHEIKYSKSSLKTIIEQCRKASQEEMKKQERLEEDDEKHAGIIQKEIEKFELKRVIKMQTNQGK